MGHQSLFFTATDTIDLFSNLSGLKINSSKTKIIWIDSKKYPLNSPFSSKARSVDLDKITSLTYDHQIPKVFFFDRTVKEKNTNPYWSYYFVKSPIIPKLNNFLIQNRRLLHHLSNKWLNLFGNQDAIK